MRHRNQEPITKARTRLEQPRNIVAITGNEVLNLVRINTIPETSDFASQSAPELRNFKYHIYF